MAGHFLGKIGLESYKDKTTALVLTAQESMYKILLVILTFTAIMWMSVFLYATFYYTYMPAISHVRPVHLQFQACGRSPGLCTFPSAVVPLTERQQLLMVGQPYKVVVELELPESPHNRDTGMFMVCGELRDGEQDIVERSCRSAILHYKSFIHNVIATLIYFPFLLSGSAEEKQLISVELFSGFQEHPDHPATSAFVEIQSQHIHIYQTYLKIHAHFTGLRYFMFHWPFLSAALGISTNFFFLSIIAFLSWYKFYVAKQPTVHVGYDANAARTLEERRRILAREKLMKEREELLSHQKADDDIIPTKKQDTSPFNDKDKLELEDSDQELKTKEQIRAMKSLKAKSKQESKKSEDFEVLSSSSPQSLKDAELPSDDESASQDVEDEEDKENQQMFFNNSNSEDDSGEVNGNGGDAEDSNVRRRRT